MDCTQDTQRPRASEGCGLQHSALKAAKQLRRDLGLCGRLLPEDGAAALKKHLGDRLRVRVEPVAVSSLAWTPGEEDRLIVTLSATLLTDERGRVTVELLASYFTGCTWEDPGKAAAQRLFADAFLAGGKTVLGPFRVADPVTGATVAEIGVDHYGAPCWTVLRLDGTAALRLGVDDAGASYVDLLDRREHSIGSLHDAGREGGALALYAPDKDGDETAYPLTGSFVGGELKLRKGWGKTLTLRVNAAGELAQEVKP